MLHKNSQKRIYLENAIYFVTTVTRWRAPHFKQSWIADFAVQQFVITKKIKPFSIYAYVIMPDHIHALILPKKQHTISEIMHTYKRHISRNVRILSSSPAGEDGHLRLPGEKTFAWQRSFHDHIIRDQEDFNHHINYIHYNPVKDGLTKKPEDWPWSSYKDFVNANHSLIDSIPY